MTGVGGAGRCGEAASAVGAGGGGSVPSTSGTGTSAALSTCTGDGSGTIGAAGAAFELNRLGKTLTAGWTGVGETDELGAPGAD